MASGRSRYKSWEDHGHEETFDYVCTSCVNDNLIKESVKFCKVCQRFCCRDCVAAHKRLPILQGHELVENSQGPPPGQHSAGTSFPTEVCSLHKGKLLEMYCGNHKVVCCCLCVAMDHTSCRDLRSVTDDIDLLYQKSDTDKTQTDMAKMIQTIKKRQTETDILLQQLQKSRTDANKEVKAYRTEIDKRLDQLETESIKQLDAIYRKMELELLDEKQRYTNIINELTKLDQLITQANKNTAQKFVCTNLGQQKLTSAEDSENRVTEQKNTEIYFAPIETLKQLVDRLTSLGNISTERKMAPVPPVRIPPPPTLTTPSVTLPRPPPRRPVAHVPSQSLASHNSLYQAKKIGDLVIKLTSDTLACGITGSCIVDDTLLVTDYKNNKLKRVDLSILYVIDFCKVMDPRGVCSTRKGEVAVACQNKEIMFVSVGNKLSLSHKLRLLHDCYGIAFSQDKLCVTDVGKSLYMYSIDGQLLQTVTTDHMGQPLFQSNNHIAISDAGDVLFVGDEEKGLVVLDINGKHITTITDTDTKAEGVCTDGRGNVILANSNTITQITQAGALRGVVINLDGSFNNPRSICFNTNLNKLVVTNLGNIVRVYTLY